MSADEEDRPAAPDAKTLAERFAKLSDTAHRIALVITGDAILRKIENEPAAPWLSEVEAALAEIEEKVRVNAQDTLLRRGAKDRRKDGSR